MSMSRKQLALFFIGSIFVWITVQGLLAMLPVYALRLGADPSATGGYLAFSFFMIAISSWAAGWLADNLQRHRLWVLLGLVASIVSVAALSVLTSFVQLIIVTGLAFFSLNMALAVIGIIAGLSAGEGERGFVFGTLGTTGGIGAMIAGLMSGKIVTAWGFPQLFLIMAGIMVISFLLLLFIQPVTASDTQQSTEESNVNTNFSWTFYMLIIASFVAFTCGFVSLLGRPLQMDGLGFDADAISLVFAIGGAVSIPLPFIFGWLSDRISRYYLVGLAYLLGGIGLYILAYSTTVWHFAISSIFVAVNGSSVALNQAIITDLVPAKVLGKALSIFLVGIGLGGVVGFLGTGYAIEWFGLVATYIGSAGLILMATMIVVMLRRTTRKVAPAVAT